MTEVSGNKVPVASYWYISIRINKADCLANKFNFAGYGACQK